MDLSNFEPIESAPRDGTSVIVACEGHPEFVKESSEGHTMAEVQMTEAEFNALPEFES